MTKLLALAGCTRAQPVNRRLARAVPALASEPARMNVPAVIDQVLWAAARPGTSGP